MIPLPTPAEVEDRVTAILVADCAQSFGHLANCGVPIDLLERPVGSPSERRRDTVRPVLIVVEAMRLLARVPLRRRMRLVAPNSCEVTVALAP